MTAPAPGEGKDLRLPGAAPPKRYAPDAMERAVLERWAKDRTFQRQVEQGKAAFAKDPAARFVFLEGPPTANGRPHPGHVLTRTLKDTVCRYQAMQGKWVPRKGGWDCHGLPVEIEVQKELGIEHVEEVLAYGLAKFNAKCRDSVFRYKAEWEEMCRRVGHWLDYDDPYVTMEDRYIESVWWSLKQLFDAGLLFKSYKVVPYCPQTGTSYSSHEVAQGYKDVTDTAVFVKFHLEGGLPSSVMAKAAMQGRTSSNPHSLPAASILSWTTTPWTLPGNVALAVGVDIDYVVVKVDKASDKATAKEGEVLIVAEALQKKALRNESTVLAKLKGRDLVGLAYQPLFPGAVDAKAAGPNGVPKKAFQIVAGDFVTTEDGTGVVHTAVMYGEDDFQLGMKEGLPARHTVGLDGNFLAHVPGGIAGRPVKAPETEATILAWLREGDLLYREEKYEHSYPHCWRTGHPLLYYAMDSWYIRMSSLRDQLLANNDRINWVPDTIKEGRMGDWLRNVKDWAFSRNRFWGTPLPVWTCSKCKAQTCIGSKAELKAAGIDAPELHRPYVDEPIDCPKCHAKGSAVREPYVIDVWYDSGAAQFAQWQTTTFDHQPLKDQWPIDFITEGLDQTRGWFYSLLAASTALGASRSNGGSNAAGAPPTNPAAFASNPASTASNLPEASLFHGPPYRNCLVGGLILAEDGQKMSKSKKNYVSPDQVFANVGADATRWYLLSTTAPWQDKRFYEDAVRDTFGKFFSTLWNTFLFQHQYAKLDHWTPKDALPAAEWADLDRWLLSRLDAAIAEARFEADRFHLHKATRAIESFVVDDLSNWWVRRSRDRFWAERSSPDKQSAHSALWTALHAVCRLVAPFAPFMVEHIWSHVRRSERAATGGEADPESVHLALWPTPGRREEDLEREMTQVRALAEAGRALRSRVDIPTRHPLGRAVVVVPAGAGTSPLGRFAGILQDEINVKQLESAHDARALKAFVAKPNRASLGKAFKKLAPQVADAIEALDGDHAHAQFAAGKGIGVSVDGHDHEVTAEHVLFEERDRPGWATTKVEDIVLALRVERDETLLAEALAREVIRRIQDVRRELDLPLDEEVDVVLECGPNEQARLDRFLHVLKADVRGRKVTLGPAGPQARAWDIDGVAIRATVVPTRTHRPAAVEAA